MSLGVWLGFLLASILIAVTPGPGVVISMSSAMRHGFRAALRVILGLQAAILAHLVIVALGVGALLAASETAFSVIKLTGALYLVWLGVAKWRDIAKVNELAVSSEIRQGFFLQGVLVNLTNPKAIIFIGALVPQFIDFAKPGLPQYLVIAATLCATDIIVMSAYALLAVRLGKWLHDPAAIAVQNKIFGSLFISAGLLLLGSSRT